MAVVDAALDLHWCWIVLLLLTAVRVSGPVRSQGRRLGSWPRVPSMAASNWVIAVYVIEIFERLPSNNVIQIGGFVGYSAIISH